MNDQRSPLQLRVMTKDRHAGVVFAEDVPNYEGFSVTFIVKLLAVRIAMGRRRTDITWGKERT